MNRFTLIFSFLSLSLLLGCNTKSRQTTQSRYHAYKSFEKKVGYAQAVRYENTLYISGTAAGGEMDSAVTSVYKQLQKTLNANDLTFANVVKENVFTTELDSFKQNKDLRKQFYVDSLLPAASWVQVDRLFTPNLVLEVELVAKYPN